MPYPGLRLCVASLCAACVLEEHPLLTPFPPLSPLPRLARQLRSDQEAAQARVEELKSTYVSFNGDLGKIRRHRESLEKSAIRDAANARKAMMSEAMQRNPSLLSGESSGPFSLTSMLFGNGVRVGGGEIGRAHV